MAKGKYILQSPLEGVDAEVGSIIEWDEDEAAELPWAFRPAKEAQTADTLAEGEEGNAPTEPEGGEEPPDETTDEEMIKALVDANSRKKLNALAEDAGVENPESFNTKADVAAAILETEHGDGGEGEPEGEEE